MTEPNYKQKMIFNTASVRHLEFGNFCHVSVAWDKICVRILSFVNSDNLRMRYGDIMIFKMAAVRHVGFSKFDIFHHLTFVYVRLCLLIPNFVLIGQYGAEL